MALVPLSHLYSPQNGILKLFWYLWSWSGHASVRGLSDHLSKEGSTQTMQFASCWTGAVFLLLWFLGFFVFVLVVWCWFFFLTAQSATISTPALGKALLWLDRACSCWLKPQKNISVQARRQNLCVDQTCSKLPDTGHTLVSLLTWKENTGLAIVPGLTNLQANVV